MLVLSLNSTGREVILFTSDGPIVIQHCGKKAGAEGVRIGIKAPDSVQVIRDKLLTDEQKEVIRSKPWIK